MSFPPGRYPNWQKREPLPVPIEPVGDVYWVPVEIPYHWIPYIASLLEDMTYHSFWAGTEEEKDGAVSSAEEIMLMLSGYYYLDIGWFWVLGDLEKTMLGWSTRLSPTV